MIWLTLLLAAAAEGESPLDVARQQSADGQSQAALETLRPLVTARSPEALALAGLIHEQQGQLLLARQSLTDALAAGSLANPGAAHLALARGYQATGDTAQGTQHATAAAASAATPEALAEAIDLLIDLSTVSLGPGEAMGLLAGAVSEDALPTTWVALADGYLARSMASAAISPLEGALHADALNPDAVHWQLRIADAASQRGRFEDEVAALEVLARDYTVGSPWADAQEATEAVDPVVIEALIEERIRTTLLTRHHLSRVAPRTPTASPQLAELSRLVVVWLVRYPDHAAAGSMHALYGDVLMRTGRFAESHTQHMAAFDLTEEPDHLFAAAFAAERLFVESAPPQQAEEQRLTAEARQLLSAVDLYVHHFPGSDDAHTLQLKAGAALTRLGRTRQARQRLVPIIEADPTTPIAERAARKVLDGYILTEDWHGVRAAALEFADSPGLSSPAFRARLDEILEQTASLR